MARNGNVVVFPRNTNQIYGLALFVIDALWSKDRQKQIRPSPEVIARTELFYLDAVLCGLSARTLLAHEGLGAMAREATEVYCLPRSCKGMLVGKMKRYGATIFGSNVRVHPEAAIFANGFAVRAWDANGTNFAYYPELGHVMGEFGHNDFYEAVIAATQMVGKDGAFAVKAMILLDEIRNRLGSVFGLKNFFIDHVLHGAIATAIVYGAIVGATADQIDQAVGMLVAHYVPFRAIRAGGEELSDSKGASAGLSTEVAVKCVHRIMRSFGGRGFEAPRDILRNPEAIFRLFAGPNTANKALLRADGKHAATISTERLKESPFDLHLCRTGDGFAIMQMHIKLALYEHQSAGAVAGVLKILREHPELMRMLREDPDALIEIIIRIYNPAYDIICQPARWKPTTREAADHSGPYIAAKQALKAAQADSADWASVMLGPLDYTDRAINDPQVRAIMAKIRVEHAPEFDAKYPEGIPTEVIFRVGEQNFGSGLIMFPPGHAAYDNGEFGSFASLFAAKRNLLGELALGKGAGEKIINHYRTVGAKSTTALASLHGGYVIPDHGKLMAT